MHLTIAMARDRCSRTVTAREGDDGHARAAPIDDDGDLVMTVLKSRRCVPICALALSAGLAALSMTEAGAATAEAAPAQAAVPHAVSPQGKWLTEGKDAALAITDCGGRYCGRIIWLDTSDVPRGKVLLDEKNPDPMRQSRRICGSVVLTGLTPSGPDSWEGRVYNPKDGRTYRTEITVLSRDALRIRAYIGLPIFGKTQTWTRVRADGDDAGYRCQGGG
jgi:uncharacterized protein (DUF2147 family)